MEEQFPDAELSARKLEEAGPSADELRAVTQTSLGFEQALIINFGTKLDKLIEAVSADHAVLLRMEQQTNAIQECFDSFQDDVEQQVFELRLSQTKLDGKVEETRGKGAAVTIIAEAIRSKGVMTVLIVVAVVLAALSIGGKEGLSALLQLLGN